MSTEEELQDELKKLEIGIGLNSKAGENPFKTHNLNESNKSDLSKIFGDPTKAKCKCRIRQTSESTLDDDIKKSRPQEKSPSNIRTTILHQKSFKPKKKPVLLREPIMKSIQNCLHQKSRKSWPTNFESTSRDPQFLEALNLASVATKNVNNSSYPLDFRDLIEQCKGFEQMKTSDLPMHTKKSKNFNSIQTTDIRTKPVPKLRNCPSCSQQARINGSGSARNHHSISVENGPNNNLNVSSMAVAGGTASSGGDDVTIDELACYFETLVHIPKKMSSMAEMMYI